VDTDATSGDLFVHEVASTACRKQLLQLAAVRMRSKVRGLRAIERELLPTPPTTEPPPADVAVPNISAEVAVVASAADAVVLDYCTVVKGILNDDQGGPLHPPGLRMAEALVSVRQSLQRNLDTKKGGARSAR
jgi:hypothetical protein